jgi:predicted Zn-dependent protease
LPGSSGGPRLVVIRDAEIETLLRTYGHPLFHAAGLDSGLVRIVLIGDRAINAFVTTGNRMFIFTGMIEKAANASELIGAMAHETGHIAGGHVSRMPDKLREAMLKSIAAMLLGAAAGVASGQAGAASAIALGGQQMAEREFLTFTRGQEAAADTAGLSFLDRNRWSAQGLLDLFHRLQDQEVLVSSEQDPYLRTHPLTRDRITFVAEHVAVSPYSRAPLPVGFNEGFAMMQAKLVGFLEQPAEALRRFPESDRTAPAYYARAVAYMRSGQTDVAGGLVDRLIEQERSVPWYHELRGQILFEGGQGQAAIVSYREATRLAPDQPLIRAGLGHALVESGDPTLLRQAIPELQAAVAREHDNGDVWRDLGVAWGRLGNTGQANLALAEEAMLRDDIPAARTLAHRAEQALPPGPAKLRAQDIANAVRKENREYE